MKWYTLWSVDRLFLSEGDKGRSTESKRASSFLSERDKDEKEQGTPLHKAHAPYSFIPLTQYFSITTSYYTASHFLSTKLLVPSLCWTHLQKYSVLPPGR